MKKIGFLVVIIIIMAGIIASRNFFASEPNQKIYVAIEGDGKIVILDPRTQKVTSSIDLSIEYEGDHLSFHPHNVEVSPDHKTVWVTANFSEHKHEEGINFQSFLSIPRASAHGLEEYLKADVLIIIDPKTDTIAARIPIAKGIHLSHVSLVPDSSFAYVTAQMEGAIYKIDAKRFEIVNIILVPINRIVAPKGSQPHGLRISPDGQTAYIAMFGNKSLGILDLKTDTFSEVPLGGQAVQTGITPDGQFVLISLYDTKQLAVYFPNSKEVKYIKLPQSSKGPIQMYPTPDSRYVYLADQGYYFEKPASEWVYKIDLDTMSVVKEIKAGQGPHGIALSPDGKFAYVTNLLSGDLSIIDTATDQEVGRVNIGKEPNGISVWKK